MQCMETFATRLTRSAAVAAHKNNKTMTSYMRLRSPFAALGRTPIVLGRWITVKKLAKLLRCDENVLFALGVHEDQLCNTHGLAKAMMPCIDVKRHGVLLMRTAGWSEENVERGRVQLGAEDEEEEQDQMPVRKRAHQQELVVAEPAGVAAAAVVDPLVVRLERIEARVGLLTTAALDEFEAAMARAFAQLRQRLEH